MDAFPACVATTVVHQEDLEISGTAFEDFGEALAELHESRLAVVDGDHRRNARKGASAGG